MRNSLVFKVFQAKYFPSSNIFDAEVSPRHSFAWRSILQAREGGLEGRMMGSGRWANYSYMAAPLVAI